VIYELKVHCQFPQYSLTPWSLPVVEDGQILGESTIVDATPSTKDEFDGNGACPTPDARRLINVEPPDNPT
jgi:hypothetical protein